LTHTSGKASGRFGRPKTCKSTCCFQVSWIRKRDLHILTVGILTYTNDQRYQSLHSDGTDEWTLKISSPQIRDSGTYECQVSTEPKISQSFRLSVVSKYLQFCLNDNVSNLFGPFGLEFWKDRTVFSFGPRARGRLTRFEIGVRPHSR